MLKGIGASQGYGIGRALIIDDIRLDYSAVKYSDAKSELARFRNAVEVFTNNTKALCEANSEGREILEGHIEMLNDPFVISKVEDNITSGLTAEASIDKSCEVFIGMFSGGDELARQRVSDIKDIRDGVLKILLGASGVDLANIPAGSVLVARDLTPSMTSQLNRSNVVAIVTELGGITSHSAIMARAMGIPAVLSLADATSVITAGEELIVDGFSGDIVLNPSDAELQKYNELRQKYQDDKTELQVYLNKQTITKSGAIKHVYANIGRPEDVQNVIQNSGEGIGLFRTEFLFMDRDSQPSEEEQLEAYSTVARAMKGREVIIRSLDIGGDKEIPYLNIEREDNPFLGHRGIRYCLDNVPLFKTQIKAVLRANSLGNIKLMLPLITSLDEVRQAKKIIDECERELTDNGTAFNSVSLGVMIETPAAVAISDELAKEVEFFSIGTNDLVGYMMAVDRGNSKVSSLYDMLHPSVLKAIEATIKNAKANGISVGMCGEAAADDRLIPKLIEWGLDEFSVNPSMILSVRRAICEN